MQIGYDYEESHEFMVKEVTKATPPSFCPGLTLLTLF